MLRRETEAVTVEPDGRGAPVPRLVSGGQPSRAGAADPQDRFWPEDGLPKLFRRTPQGYSPPGSERAGQQSGECRLNGPTCRSTSWLVC